MIDPETLELVAALQNIIPDGIDEPTGLAFLPGVGLVFAVDDPAFNAPGFIASQVPLPAPALLLLGGLAGLAVIGRRRAA
ncbi:MAG: VPLPA-CTERM sorting domain-containing protein [Pseudomonadota bacterium]